MAMSDETQVWHCHHRLETHTSDGEKRLIDLTPTELRALGVYYDRPPEELIFLTSEEHRKVHTPWNKDKKTRPLSESHKAKISAAMKGGNSGSFKKEHIPWNKGKSVDISQYKNYGKHKSYHRAWNAKKILCVETNIIYDSIDEAAKSVGLKSHGGINLCCLGKQSTAGGLHWEYK